MLATRNAVLISLMLLLVSAILTLQVASASERVPGFPELAMGQPLPNSVLKDLTGKASLVGFGNGFTDMVVQANSGGGLQVSTADVFSTQSTLSGSGVKTTPFDATTASQFRSLISYFKK